MRTLIIGKGQVGQSLFQVIKDFHETFIRDLDDLKLKDVSILQICYPDHKDFENTTKRYIEKYNPILTIINSSVSVGTTDKCGPGVVYSPVRGRHPKLVSDMKIYQKFIFGRNPADLSIAENYFHQCGLDVSLFDDPKAGELMKLISNVHMGVEIAWRQEVQRMLEILEIEPLIYEMWEDTYSKGYIKSGDYNLIRPSMSPGPIGGHCIIPCTEILKKQFPSKILEFILESNEKSKTKHRS